jgi:hypothetical protein
MSAAILDHKRNPIGISNIHMESVDRRDCTVGTLSVDGDKQIEAVSE